MKPESVHNVPGTLSSSFVVPPHPGAEQADGEPGDDEEGGDARHCWSEDHRGETEVRFVHQNSCDCDVE